MKTTRREFLSTLSAAAYGLMVPRALASCEMLKPDFSLKYILASCMYGYMKLSTILPEMSKLGTSAIDIWHKKHGNQREQLEEMGEEKFAALLKEYNVQLGCITAWELGINLNDDLRMAARLGCKTVVTGDDGRKGLKGSELKSAVRSFIEKMKPQLEVAEESGVTIAIENHSMKMLNSPDAIKWLLEFRPSDKLAIALAPYHLPQDEKLLSDLIRSLGEGLEVFYAWQYGMGCMEKLPKEQELMQMPGRGTLDFRPLLAALRDIDYRGWTEIFMHPTPRGIPIRDTASTVTAEINRARDYLAMCLSEI